MGEDAAVGLHPALPGGIRAHPGEALVPLVGGGGPGQRPQGDRVHHHVLAVGLQPAQARLVAPPGPGRLVTVALDGDREAGEVVGLAQVDPGLGRGRSRSARPATLPPGRPTPVAALSVECRPVPDIDQRDPDEVAAILTRWLATKAADGAGPEVFDVQAPASNGFSNETILCRTRTADGEERRLVVRVAPTKHLLFMDAEFSTQYRVMRALADGGSAVPLPPLGLVRGGPAVPGRALLHHGPRRGPGAAGQHPLHHGGLGHRGHARAAGAHVVERHRRPGRRAPDRLARRSASTGSSMPARGRARDRAADVLLPRLSWTGRPRAAACRCSSRPGSGWWTTSPPRRATSCSAGATAASATSSGTTSAAAAVLDWEMASLGQPEMDLGLVPLLRPPVHRAASACPARPASAPTRRRSSATRSSWAGRCRTSSSTRSSRASASPSSCCGSRTCLLEQQDPPGRGGHGDRTTSPPSSWPPCSTWSRRA